MKSYTDMTDNIFRKQTHVIVGLFSKNIVEHFVAYKYLKFEVYNTNTYKSMKSGHETKSHTFLKIYYFEK